MLFISGDGGWNLGVVSMAERLRDLGALVVGIDIRTFLKNLEGAKGCAYPAGALEELSRAVQIHRKLPAYKRPIVVGYSSGATLAYAALASAPPETFAGAISVGLTRCARRPHASLRGGDRSSRLFSLPKVGHGFGVPGNWDPPFVEAYKAIANAPPIDAHLPGSVPEVADLSLVEVAATIRGDTDLSEVGASDARMRARAWWDSAADRHDVLACHFALGAHEGIKGKSGANPARSRHCE